MLAYGQTGSGKSFTMQEDPDHIGRYFGNESELGQYLWCQNHFFFEVFVVK